MLCRQAQGLCSKEREGLQSIECKVFSKGTPETENMVRKTNPGSEAESLAYLISTNKGTDRESSEKAP